MKQMSLIEMDGFLKGKCIPSDLKVNETNAEYLVRKFGELESKLETAFRECRSSGITIDNLEAKCEALAAENARLKSAVTQQIELRAEIKKAGRPPHADFWVQSICEAEEKVKRALEETQATDAFLDEVRAQAFNDLCSAFVKDATVVGLDDGDIVTVKEATDALLHCAEQLHKGVHS
ncbi:hypothetical protein FQY73_21725 [Escherichia coli]|nr:hypothetical protein [Escherichia coli]EIF2380061.1 hypothetical protein [Escherichia coli]